MAHHIFQLEDELQNIPEALPKPSFSVSERLARYRQQDDFLDGSVFSRRGLVGSATIIDAVLSFPGRCAPG
jgi:hypothetical protein